MRLSRKAGLLACIVRWIKHECTRIQNGYDFGQYHVWTVDEEGTDTSVYFQGYTSFQIVLSGTKYVYEPAGDQGAISVDSPGTVYVPSGTTLYRYTVNRSGYYRQDHNEVTTHPHYEYPAGDEIGTVRAAKGEYPDAENGYTYVTTYDGYTIMEYGGAYYAYKTAT